MSQQGQIISRLESPPITGGDRVLNVVRSAVEAATVPCTVVLRIRICDAAVDRLMAIKGITSVVLAASAPAVAERYPGRVGWYHEDAIGWTLPHRLASELVYVGPRAEFGFRAANSAWRAGVRGFRSTTPPLDRRLALEVIATFGRGIAYRLSRTRVGSVLDVLHSASLDKMGRALRMYASERCSPPPGSGVMLVTGSLGPGGSERQVTNTLIGLTAKGVNRPTLLHEEAMESPHDFFLREVQPANVSTVQLIPLQLRTGQEWSACQGAVALYECLKPLGPVREQIVAYAMAISELRPQVVHTWLDRINVTAGLAAVLVGVPRVVLSCRSVNPSHFGFHQPYMRPLYRLLHSFPNVTMLNNSRAGALDYEKWLDLPPGSIQIIHNGFDFSRMPVRASTEATEARASYRARIEVPFDAIVVGSIMRLSEEKRPLLWMQTAAHIARQFPDSYFLIVGHGPLRDDARHYAETHGFGNRIRFIQSESDVARALAAMDVFLLTSRIEGLPNVLIEAQAMGVPVVATAVGGVPETIEEGVTGYAVASDDPQRLAEKIAMLLKDASMYREAQIRAELLSREVFSITTMVNKTVRTYGVVERTHGFEFKGKE